jgi:iron complex outermembrane receptor protein
MENPVVGAPQHKAYAGATWATRNFTLSTGFNWIDGLYLSTPSNSNPRGVQESYLQWNMRAMYRLSESISLQARGENLLNQKYEINAGYPMPGATVMLGINIEF